MTEERLVLTLKSCPFCGSTYVYVSELINKSFGMAWMQCSECGARGPTLKYTDVENLDYDGVVDAWNRRDE
jgi:Lar family restriction alleviation protein